MTKAEIDELLQRLKDGQVSETDRQVLCQLLTEDYHTPAQQSVTQQGRFNVNLGEGQEVHIGDRIIQSADPELIRAIMKELLTFQKQLGNDETEPILSFPIDGRVDLIDIKPQVIHEINNRLAAIQELQNTQPLSETQVERLKVLRHKIQSLKNKDVEQILKEIADNAEQVLQDAIKSLASRLKELSHLRPADMLADNSENCISQELTIMQEFQQELEEGRRVAAWLDERRSHLAEILGQHALESYPTLQSSDKKTIGLFYFTIEQFLERLSHCLTWGDSDTLETPEIPRVLAAEVYSAAFNHLRSVVPLKRTSQEGIAQLNEYIDVILENLPSCRKLEP